PVFARPGDVLVVADLEEQVEVLGKQRVVVLEPEAEQRKRVDERATADHHLRAAPGEEVEGGEALKHPYRIDGTQNGDGTRETDALGSRRRRRENHGRGGVEVVTTVVLADSEHIQ